jgi:hypothetical protein
MIVKRELSVLSAGLPCRRSPRVWLLELSKTSRCSSRRNSIPVLEHSRAQALKMRSSSSARRCACRDGFSVEQFYRCEPPSLFVFGRRRVGLLQITDFTHFARRTTYVGEKSPELGCVGSVLVRSRHLTRPSRGRQERDRLVAYQHRGLRLSVRNKFTWG